MFSYRKFKHFNSTNFRSDISTQPWENIKELYNPNDMWKKWKDLFLSVCDKHAPVKTKRTRPTKSPWITTNLKKQMNFRDRLKNKAIKTKDAFIWNQFRKVKNQVNQEIKSPKKAYYNYNAFNNYAGDQRKTWKTTCINELTSRKSNITVINEIQHQGQKSRNQVEISELLNNSFIEIGPSLRRNVANVDTTYEEFLCATAKQFIFEEITSFCLSFQNFVSQRPLDWIKSQLNC